MRFSPARRVFCRRTGVRLSRALVTLALPPGRRRSRLPPPLPPRAALAGASSSAAACGARGGGEARAALTLPRRPCVPFPRNSSRADLNDSLCPPARSRPSVPPPARSADALSKQYGFANKVEVTAPANDITFTSEAVIAGKAPSVFVKGVYATGVVKHELKLSSDKKINYEGSLDNALGAGTKVTFKASDGTRAAGAEAVTAVLGAEYKSKAAFVTAEVDTLKFSVGATGIFSVYEGFYVGAQAKVDLAKGADVADFNAALAYKDKATTVAVVTDKKLSLFSLGIHSVVSDKTAFAATVKAPVAMKQSPNFDVEAGVVYKVDKDTTLSAKVTSAGKVAGSYKAVLSSVATVTFAGEVDTVNIGSDNHQFGTTVALSF